MSDNFERDIKAELQEAIDAEQIDINPNHGTLKPFNPYCWFFNLKNNDFLISMDENGIKVEMIPKDGKHGN